MSRVGNFTHEDGGQEREPTKIGIRRIQVNYGEGVSVVGSVWYNDQSSQKTRDNT